MLASGFHCWGNQTKKPCIFPFKVHGHFHPKCTTAHHTPPFCDHCATDIYSGPAWCATKINPEGGPVDWEFCHHECYGKGAKKISFTVSNHPCYYQAFLWKQFRYYENEILLDECLSKCEAIERKFLKEGEEIKKGK